MKQNIDQEFVIYKLVIKKEDYQKLKGQFDNIPVDYPIYNHIIQEGISYDKLQEMNLGISQEQNKEKQIENDQMETEIPEFKNNQQQDIDDIDFEDDDQLEQEEEDNKQNEQQQQQKKQEEELNEDNVQVLQDDEEFELLEEKEQQQEDDNENQKEELQKRDPERWEREKKCLKKKFHMWLTTRPCGQKVKGTNIVPGKTPLLLNRWKPLFDSVEERCYMKQMLEDLQKSGNKIRLFIDLTENSKYYTFWKCKKYANYGYSELLKDVEYIKFPISSKNPPRKDQLNKIYNTINQNLHKKDFNIFMHCFCGINRTGYVISYFLCKKYNISSKEAIKRFEEAVGYKFENQMLIDDLEEKFDF